MIAKWLPQSSLEWPTSVPFSQGRFGEQASMISCHASPVAHLQKCTRSMWERDIKRVKERERTQEGDWPEEQQNSLRKRLKVVVSVDLAVVPQANLTKHLWSQKNITHHQSCPSTSTGARTDMETFPWGRWGERVKQMKLGLTCIPMTA